MPVRRGAPTGAGKTSTATAAAASTTRLTHAKLAKRGDDDRAVARPVELAEEDPLPLTECELAVAERDHDLRARQRRTYVRGCVRPVGILDVLPVPAVVDDLLQCGLEVLGDERVGVLVDVHELGLPLGLQSDLLHAVILGTPCRRRSTNESSTPSARRPIASSRSSTR